MDLTPALVLEGDLLQEHEGGKLHNLGPVLPGEMDQDGDDQGGKPDEKGRDQESKRHQRARLLFSRWRR